MTDLVDDVIRRHRSTGIVVDTNVLLLFLIGSFGRTWVSSFKNTSRYVPEDFDTISMVLGEFDKIIATPNILTELSNLAGQLGDPSRTKFFNSWRRRYSHSSTSVMFGVPTQSGLTNSPD